MQDTFTISLDKLGLLLFSQLVGQICVTLMLGRLVGRIPFKYVLMIGMACIIIATGGYGIAPTFAVVIAFAAIMGIGSGLIDAGLNMFIAAHYESGPMNWLHAFFGIGTMLGPLWVTLITIQLGLSWRMSYFGVILLELTVLILFVITHKQWALGEDVRDQLSPDEAITPGIIETIIMPTVAASMIFFFFYAGLEAATGQLSNTLFVEARGASQATSSFWISTYWAMFTLSRMIAGSIIQFTSNLFVKRAGTVLAVIGGMMLWLNPTNTVGFMGMALIGFGIGPLFAIIISETSQRFGQRFAPTIIGFQMSSAIFGVFAVPAFAGVLSTQIGKGFIGVFLFAVAVGLFIFTEWLQIQSKGEKWSVRSQLG